MKNILIISYSRLDRDPRIQRQIKTFNNTFNIETIGLSPANDLIKNFLPKKGHVSDRKYTLQNAFILIKMILGYFGEINYHRIIKPFFEYDIKTPDMIIANDWLGLLVACELKKYKDWNSKIYFDSHEYFPEYRNSLKWKILLRPRITYVLKKYRDSFDVMSTVCPSLARRYERYYHFKPDTVRVVTNAPDYEPELRPQDVGDRIRIIHHGLASPLRKIEKMIDIMAYLPEDKYELYFMLMKSDKAYYDEMVRYASRYSNIHFLEPVPFTEIPSFTNQFDIGLLLPNNDNVSYKYSLPNKFFEFVQARLAIAIGDSYEMKQYVERYDLGVVARENSPEAMAAVIEKMSREDIMMYKQNAHKYARELSAETNMKILMEIAEELLGKAF